MRKVLIITDSCSDLTYNKSGDNLFVVPFYMCYEGFDTNLQKDMAFNGKRNIIYRDANVITTGCSYNELYNVLNYAVDNDMDVICLYSSKHFNMSNSKTFELTVKEFKERNPHLNVACIDSQNLSYALGLLVEDIKGMSDDGASFKDILNYINQNKHLYTLEFIVNYDEYLRTYYGVKWFDRYLLRFLKNSPVFVVDDGKIMIEGVVPEEQAKLDMLLENYVVTTDLEHKAVITHTDNEDGSILFNDMISSVFDKKLPVVESSRVTSSIIKGPSLCLAYKKASH